MQLNRRKSTDASTKSFWIEIEKEEAIKLLMLLS